MQEKHNDSDELTLGFIDRDDVRKQICSAYHQLYNDITYFEVISIYGIGGIGKTSLLKELFRYNQTLPIEPTYMTLEITEKDDLLDILIKFRKALPQDKKYPLFDYAVLYAWNSLNTSKLDDDFLNMAKTNTLSFFKPFVAVAAGKFTDFPIGEIIEIGINLLDKLIVLCKDKTTKKIVRSLGDISFQELLQSLPYLLGTDIHNAFLNDHFALVIDSFQPCSAGHSSQWLAFIIEQIRYGVYIVTSREEIIWPASIQKSVRSRNLAELPKNDVRTELQNQFGFKAELIEHIIEVTGCVPIYLDLAVRVILDSPEKETHRTDVFFKSKEDVVIKFLSHLSSEERGVINALAIVQIFDQDIFEHLVKDLNLPMPIYSFEQICKRTLVRNYEEDRDFYKIHDIISENIRYTTEPAIVHRVVRSYLCYIHARHALCYSSLATNMLLKHLIFLYGQIAPPISQEETEQLLDLYFAGKEALLPFSCNGIDGFEGGGRLKYLYYFLRALSEERANSKVRLEWLDKIDESACLFGKHVVSLHLMKGYLCALCKGTQYLKQAVEEINPKLSGKDHQEWYYGQTKIFLGDCLISYGQYRSGIAELQAYREEIPHLIGKATDAFQVGRHIGHAYRFNMLLDEAEQEYAALISSKDPFPTALQRVYILTNLCETCCYFKPKNVFDISEEALRLSDNFHDLKSKGKINYSLAIAWLHAKDYDHAKDCIRQSLIFNQEDGYIAGQLYAYMAQSYLEYAQKRQIEPETLSKIEGIIHKIEVYSCFYLPIALMKEDYSRFKEIRASQEWLNFDRTAATYRSFLDCLI